MNNNRGSRKPKHRKTQVGVYLGILLLALVLTASAWGAPAGTVLWTEDGIPLRSGEGTTANLNAITSDGAGGAIIAWQDNRSGFYDIYVQRVDSTGNPLWSTNGVALRRLSGSNVSWPKITSDGACGAIVTWYDGRSGVNNIYAQRVDSAGNPLWAANGVALRSITDTNAILPKITSDGAGGAIVVWEDRRTGVGDIYAQRVDSAGNPLWAANGVALRSIAGSNAGSAEFTNNITSDGAGGAIVTWRDEREVTHHIYAQRVDSEGNTLWYANGVALKGVESWTGWPNIISDGRRSHCSMA